MPDLPAPRPTVPWRLRVRHWLAFGGLVAVTWLFIGIGAMVGWQVRESEDLRDARAEIVANRAAIDRNRAEIMLRASPAELQAIQQACPTPARGVK